MLEQKWAEKTKANSRLYSQSKFRLHSLETKDGKLKLNVGLSSYKEFVGTNLNDKALEFTSDRSNIADIIG